MNPMMILTTRHLFEILPHIMYPDSPLYDVLKQVPSISYLGAVYKALDVPSELLFVAVRVDAEWRLNTTLVIALSKTVEECAIRGFYEPILAGFGTHNTNGAR